VRIVTVVQARVGSARLPGKVLADLGGRPVLAHVLERAALIDPDATLVLAIPAGPSDDPLVEVGLSAGALIVRGSAEDVLDRYHQAAERTNADAVVRITADCPLLDPAVSSRVVARFRAGDVDYVSNVHPSTYPDGYDTEVISSAALDAAWHEAVDPYEREHVTAFVWQRRGRFRCANVADDVDRSSWRLTLDSPEDLENLRQIYQQLRTRGAFGLAHVIALRQTA
jgi:spore coat polysaccharide biosynthesis protein SpsF (cytidylyltransferase family)